MNERVTKRIITIVILIVVCFIAAAIAADCKSKQAACKAYEANNIGEAITGFKAALAAALPEAAAGKVKEAVDLAKGGKADEAEKILLSLFDDAALAGRARYELGVIYATQDKTDEAAMMLSNALKVVNAKGATYVGTKGCKKCHIKQYRSWQKTKSAGSFEVLKAGVEAEVKTKLKFDPQKDYTKDPKCLECHTTGFGLPGGYVIPKDGDAKSAAQAKDNEGITCEACHGPGSLCMPIFKKAMMKKEKYTTKQLYDLGMFPADERSCTQCHNRRNPTAGADYHFNFAENKEKDTHEHVTLKYRKTE